MRVQTIKECVAEYFGIGVSNIVNRFPRSEDRWPRQLAIYVTYNLTDYSLLAIAKEFRLSDHATVMYARNRVEKRIKEIAACRLDYEAIVEYCVKSDEAKGPINEKVASICILNKEGVAMNAEITRDQLMKIERFLQRIGVIGMPS